MFCDYVFQCRLNKKLKKEKKKAGEGIRIVITFPQCTPKFSHVMQKVS